MAVAIKSAFIVFILIGIFLISYGAWEMWKTVGIISASSGKTKAQFAGYYRELHRVPSGLSLKGSGVPSVAHYPEFTFRTTDGSMLTVRETKVHVFEWYKPGQEVDILLFPHFKPRLAGFFSLYMRDILILVLGIGLFIIPILFWHYALPHVSSSGSAALHESSSESTGALDPAEDGLKRFLNSTIGPVSVKAILMASGIFMGLALIVTVAAGLYPYVTKMGFGVGGRLIAVLQEERFDEARRMIETGSGINTVNDFGQNPLLIALEAGRMDLAVLLIKAGNDVNIRSKMHMTPLRAAAEAGDLTTVKLLLGKGASPQHPDDRVPPFFYAMIKGHDEIARLLLEAGTDLHRRYPLQDGRTATVGDLTMLAGKDELVALIRLRGGTFSRQ
jgi:hypothetical protein